MSARNLIAEIKSKDIDKSKITAANMEKLYAEFPQCDPDTLARYLIARKNKIKAATKLLRNAENWRSLHCPILKQDCLGEIKKGKIFVTGTDKEGRPLLVFRSRFHNPKDRDPEEMAKMVVWWTEQAIKSLPSDKSKFSILFDRTDAPGAQDFEFVKYFAKLFQDAYPERLSKLVVYPSGVIFWSLWNVVKWFLDPVTRQKVSPCVYFYGVQEFIPDESIPVAMGGKCTYEFNADDFVDPYPEELVTATLERREKNGPATPGSFFKNDDNSVSSSGANTPNGEAEEEEEDEEDDA